MTCDGNTNGQKVTQLQAVLIQTQLLGLVDFLFLVKSKTFPNGKWLSCFDSFPFPDLFWFRVIFNMIHVPIILFSIHYFLKQFIKELLTRIQKLTFFLLLAPRVFILKKCFEQTHQTRNRNHRRKLNPCLSAILNRTRT